MLNIIGSLFAALSAWFGYAAISMSVTVDTEGGSVANLEAMHVQAGNLSLCIGAAIVAALFFVGAAVVSAIKAQEPS